MQVINYEIDEEPEDKAVPESLKRVFTSSSKPDSQFSLFTKV